MPGNDYSIATISQYVGQELGVSEWITINQERINDFADFTGDHQWIHVDVERAKRESLFGTTIAHGYLTLSLAAALSMGLGIIPAGVSQVLNYGLDKVRFLAPVKSGTGSCCLLRNHRVRDVSCSNSATPSRLKGKRSQL